MDRAAMYGSVAQKWKGSYPNALSSQERQDLEYAMLRRASDGSQNITTWKNYNFYGSYNGKYQVFTPLINKEEQIMQVYATKAEKETLRKFGASGRDVLSTTGLSSEVKLMAEDKDSKFVPEMMRDSEIANLMARKARVQSSQGGIDKKIQEIMALKDTDEQQAISKLGQLNSSLKKYGNSLQHLIDLGSEIDASVGEMVVKHQESRLGDAIRLDQKSYTAALNVLEQVDFLKKITDQIDNDSTKLPNFGLTGNKTSFKDRGVVKERNQVELMKWSSSKGEYKRESSTKRDIETLTRNLQGSMTNYLGGIYEIAIASTLKNSFQDIFSAVEMTGANTSSGPGATKVGFSTTPLGRELMSKTSKTDIHTKLRSISGQADITMNLSVKNQRFDPSKNSQTKALETSLDFLIKAIITEESHRSTLETAFTNPSLFKAASSMNSFLGALMADMSIAGLPGDRIDFMVYQNAIVPLADYYKMVNRVSIAPTGGVAKAVQSVLSTGSTSIAFRVRTRGL